MLTNKGAVPAKKQRPLNTSEIGISPMPDPLNTPIIWPTQLLKAASVLFIVGAVAWIYVAAVSLWGNAA